MKSKLEKKLSRKEMHKAFLDMHRTFRFYAKKRKIETDDNTIVPYSGEFVIDKDYGLMAQHYESMGNSVLSRFRPDPEEAWLCYRKAELAYKSCAEQNISNPILYAILLKESQVCHHKAKICKVETARKYFVKARLGIK